MEVFISFTWDPETNDAAVSYEEPKKEIHARLAREPNVRVILDTEIVKRGDDIQEFMKKAASECELFVMIQSEKYWKSPNCVFEV